jgi:two-component system, NtrC family, sensor histidine kinase HydH
VNDAASAQLVTLSRRASQALFARLLVVRLMVGPLMVAVMATAAWLDPVPWRVVLAGVLILSVVGLFGGEYVRFRRGWAGPEAFALNIVAMLWIQLGVIVLTGGLDSPVAPLLPMVALQLALVFDLGRVLFAVVGAQLTVIWGLAVLYADGVSLAIPVLGSGTHGSAWPWVCASAFTLLLGAGSFLGSRVRRKVGDIVGRAIGAHDSERLAHAEHARELVALTGEIAHELKNPLASIKGLASLLARDLEGKAGERLSVLRAEVERMEETLADFLDFSRPLVPLAVEEVDLRKLSYEVVELCEGVAQARGVTLTVAPEGGRGSADRRKLRQVLVNLVQNSIEAAPAGSEVRVVATDGRVEVLDRGPGIPEELGASVFDPGVTTRARGNGLGLTIARALVLQHGGTLTLDARDGGGTCARVTL